MKMMKQPYIAPDVERLRVFLEDGIAAKASLLLSGASNIQQTNWSSVIDEPPVGAGTDPQGDLWIY
jgi:hypothetical protein